jgi:hypothetical protein
MLVKVELSRHWKESVPDKRCKISDVVCLPQSTEKRGSGGGEGLIAADVGGRWLKQRLTI